MKRLLILTVLLASLCLFTGCYSSVNTAENVDKSYQRNFVKNKRVLTDSSLAGRLEVTRIDKQDLDSGFLKIQATVRNTGRGNFKFYYRVSWFDEAGMSVETPASTWIEKDILGGDVLHLQAVAPNIRCRDFVIRFRETD